MGRLPRLVAVQAAALAPLCRAFEAGLETVPAVEPTSATAVAALEVVLQQAAPDETVVVPLTGSGLKGSPVL